MAEPVNVDACRIRGLTLIRPWGWAIAHAGKDVENRTWSPPRAAVGGWLEDVTPLPSPVPCKGALGLWTLPEPVLAAVRAGWKQARRGHHG